MIYGTAIETADEEGNSVVTFCPKVSYLVAGLMNIFPRTEPHIHITDNVPLTVLLRRLRTLFKRRYVEQEDESTYQDVRVEDVLGAFRDALGKEGWPADKANDQLPVEARTGFIKKRTTKLESVEEDRSCTTQIRASSKRPRDEMESTDEHVSEGELSSLQTAPASHEEPPRPDKRKKPKK
jgi:hypothetical protein